MAKPARHSQKSAPPPQDIEQLAAAEMAAGRFRKARDHYKELCRTERDRYLPLLIEANRRLAAQMMEKGQLAEAAQVIAYLKTIAPPGDLLGIEIEQALSLRDWPAALQSALRLLELTKGAAPTDGPDAAKLAADAIILGFPTTEELARVLPEALAGEAGAILGALRDVSLQQYEAATEKLRPLPRGSIFAAWKTFLKGLIAWHSGEEAKARQLFAGLPAGSAPARAALPYGAFLGTADLAAESTRPALIEGVCHLLGTPALAPFLTKADTQWRAGRYRDAYLQMRQAPRFPSLQADLAGLLSEFFFKRPSSMSAEDADQYLKYFANAAGNRSFKSDTEAQLIFRLLGCDAFNHGDVYDLEPYWRGFLDHLKEPEPAASQMASLVLERVGNAMAENAGICGFEGEPEEEEEGLEAAADLLEESTKHNPQNLSAYFKLLNVYKLQNEAVLRRKLLEQMTRLFADNKTVWLEAGAESLERRAFDNALKCFQRALELDRLDPQIHRRLVEARLACAAAAYQSGKLPAARAHFEAIEPYLLQTGSDFVRSMEFARARQGVLESLFGEKAHATRLLNEARSLAGSLPALLLITHASFVLWQGKSKLKSPFLKELESHPPQTAADRLALFEALIFVCKTYAEHAWKSEQTAVRKILEPLARKAFNAAECAALLPKLEALRDFTPLAKAIAKTGARKAPQYALFRILDLILSPKPATPALEKEVIALQKQAREQGDPIAETFARELHESVSGALDDISFGNSFLDPDFDLPPDLPPGMPPDLAEAVEELDRMTHAMSDAELDKFFKTIPRDMPPAMAKMLRMMLEVKRATRGIPGLGATTSRPAGKNRSQLDLF